MSQELQNGAEETRAPNPSLPHTASDAELLLSAWRFNYTKMSTSESSIQTLKFPVQASSSKVLGNEHGQMLLTNRSLTCNIMQHWKINCRSLAQQNVCGQGELVTSRKFSWRQDTRIFCRKNGCFLWAENLKTVLVASSYAASWIKVFSTRFFLTGFAHRILLWNAFPPKCFPCHGSFRRQLNEWVAGVAAFKLRTC